MITTLTAFKAQFQKGTQVFQILQGGEKVHRLLTVDKVQNNGVFMTDESGQRGWMPFPMRSEIVFTDKGWYRIYTPVHVEDHRGITIISGGEHRKYSEYEWAVSWVETLPLNITRIFFSSDIKKTLVIALVAQNDIPPFSFLRIDPFLCAIDAVAPHDKVIQAIVDGIQESGLDDYDDDHAWFRYQDILITTLDGSKYKYHVDMPELNETRGFDIQDLNAYYADDSDHEQIIRDAIDAGELTPDAKFLEEYDD